MTVQEYRERLFGALADFDPDEVRSAVDYYTELIEDADDPQAQMDRLGAPEQLAQRIIRENGWAEQNTQGYQQYGQTAQNVWGAGRVLALFFTLPIWITVYALIFALGVTLLAVYFALPVAFIAAAAIAVRYSGVLLPYSIEMIFLAVLSVGLSILLFRILRLVMRIIGMLTAKFSYFLFMPGHLWKRKARSRRPIRKGVLIAGAITAVIGFSGTAVMERYNYKNLEAYKQSLNLESFDKQLSDDLTDVTMDISLGEVTVLKSSDGEVWLSCENVEKSRLTVNGKDKANIKYAPLSGKGNYMFGFNLGFINRFEDEITARFTLYLPEGMLDSIDIKNSLGTVKLEGLTTGEVSIDCDCGDIEMIGCDIGILGIDNALGVVEISESCISRSTIEANCGSVRLDNTEHLDTADLTCDLGDIDLDGCTFYRLIADNSCGDIKADNCLITGDADLTLDLGAAKLKLIGSDYDVRAATDLGDVTINGEKGVSVTYGSVLVKVQCSSGSIKVDFE